MRDTGFGTKVTPPASENHPIGTSYPHQYYGKPLLGMVDLALASTFVATAIALVAMATTIFNLIYWNFSFLRMGTTGLTAQANGTGSRQAMGRLLGHRR